MEFFNRLDRNGKRNSKKMELVKGCKSISRKSSDSTESTEDSSYQKVKLDQPLNQRQDLLLMTSKSEGGLYDGGGRASALTSTATSSYPNPRHFVVIEDPTREGFWPCYFYGSVTAIQIYTVLVTAILVGRLWVLHGITLVLLRVILDITYAWQQYFLHHQDLHKALGACQWLFDLFKSNPYRSDRQKELEFILAGNALQYWKKSGRDSVQSWWRKKNTEQCHRVTQELKQIIHQTELLRKDRVQ